MSNIKKQVCFFVLLIMFSFSAYSQQTFNFYYISHTRSSSEATLIETLKSSYPLDESEAALFYLANSERPVVVAANIKNFDTSDLVPIINEINQKSLHEIYPEVDLVTIPDLLAKAGVIGKDGVLNYDMFIMNFYVDTEFLEFNSESIVSSLYYVLDLEQLPAESFSMRIFHNGSDDTKLGTLSEKNLFSGYEPVVLTY